MNDHRWKQISRLYHAGLARDESQRAEFLAEACGEDDELRREVESLLARERSAEGFLSAPAIEMAAKAMAHGGSQPGISGRESGSDLVGHQIGGYQILSRLGAGGMGEVYRARDSRLGRDVAIKVLPSLFASDAERLQRFEREARLLASLNHPHIGAIYGVEDALAGAGSHIRALIMELVDGPTLADRLTRGPVPIQEALKIGRQIAGALEAAHDKGIVHRDLKPANIMLTRDGDAKVLDFGLAKAFARDGSAPGSSHAPTVTDTELRPGAILGTPAYMSPEQARGQAIDKRTDIWAFGCVLYEMLTGRPAFRGETISDTIAVILEREPAWTALPQSTPASVRRLLAQCLDKDPKRRLRDIGQARIELDDAMAQPSARDTRSGVSVPTPLSRRASEAGAGSATARVPRWVAVAAGLVLLLLVAALAGVTWRSLGRAPAAEPRVVRLTLSLPAGQELVSSECTHVAISPAGTNVAYVARAGGRVQIYLRPIDSLEATALAGTESADCPFFSPDGKWIGFFAERKLKKVSLASGITQMLCDAAYGGDGSWSPDGSIYFTATGNSGLSKISADGGSPTEVTTLDRVSGEVSHRWIQVLPGGKALMFGVWTGPGRDEVHVHVLRLDTGERTVVVQGGAVGRYVASGHVTYRRDSELFAVPFDLDRLKVSGAAVRLADDVGPFSVSDAGDLVYAPDSPERLQRRLVWVDRNGRVEPLAAPERQYRSAAISLDGRYAAVDIGGGAVSIWTYDFSRTTLTRLQTGPGSSQTPSWTPDGKRIVYRGTRAGTRNLWWKTVDDATSEERLTAGEGLESPGSWSADGESFVYGKYLPATTFDVWALTGGDDREPRAVVSTSYMEGNARLSADGRWLAYASNEPGRFEVFVQPFGRPGRRWQISTDGGLSPVWSRDGRELFYLNGDRMMAVEITTAPTFEAGAPRLLFEGRYTTPLQGVAGYDVSLDGKRFLRIQPMHPDPPATQIHVVLNWFEELRRRVPVT